jgi:hypothetical protein
MPILGIIDSAKGGNLVSPAYDSIASFTGGGNATISFTSIPQTYKHLELRVYGRTNASGTGAIDGFMTFNSVSSNYNWHEIVGSQNTTKNASAGVNTTQIQFMRNCLPRASESGYGFSVATIIDYTSANFKSVNIRCGWMNASIGGVSVVTGSSTITSAITRMDLTVEGGATWTSDTVLQLYGIKG